MVRTLPRQLEDGDSTTHHHDHVDQTKDNHQHGSRGERRGSLDPGNAKHENYIEADRSPLHKGNPNSFKTPVSSDKSPESDIVQQESQVSGTLPNSPQNLPSPGNGNVICSNDKCQMTETDAQDNSCGTKIVVTQDKEEDDNGKPIRGQKFRKRSFSSMKSGSINSGSVNSDSSGYLAGSSLALGVPDLSDFERVWETEPEVIIKAARLASAETLTPYDDSSLSSLPHTQPYHSPLKTPSSILESSDEPNLKNPFSETPSAFVKSNPENVDKDDDIINDVHIPTFNPIDNLEDNIRTHLSCDDIIDDCCDEPRTFTDHYFSQPQLSNLDAPVNEEWSCDNQSGVGEVGGIGHACGCGINVEDNYVGKNCSVCMVPNPVYYSEQFPSNDLLENFEIDGSKHIVHVDLATGQVKLHLHVHHKCGMPPTETTQAYIDNKCPKHKNENNIKDLPSTSTHPQENEPDKIKFCQPFGFSSGIGEPSVYHALVVIFLEFFAWGLLTSPMISVLNETFPDHTFLMNGLIVGIKGILSFLSAPLIGALSDVWGRKFFLFITVFFTCLPIPFMKINTWWYFALISMSGVFAVTFSIVFAYVADVTDEEDRSAAYGLVSATFAASLVTSPALGAYLGTVHSDDLVVGLATAIAILDVFFILVAVPESLPEKLRLSSTWSANITWEQADPFTALWKVSKDRNVLLISLTVLLSYLPEAGQYSCFFVYLRLVMGFSPEMVATFIAAIGILSVIAQTALLSLLMKKLSNKHVIIIGLVFEMLQLMWYGFGSQMWMMWAAGLLASVSSITYPAISAYVSTHTEADKQGVVQGIITGMRGLCSGLGPAVYGFIFYMFHVDLNDEKAEQAQHHRNSTKHHTDAPNLIPGPPFVFGAFMVILALMVSAFIPDNYKSEGSPKRRKQSDLEILISDLDSEQPCHTICKTSLSSEVSYERRSQGHKKKDSLDAASLPLMEESGVL